MLGSKETQILDFWGLSLDSQRQTPAVVEEGPYSDKDCGYHSNGVGLLMKPRKDNLTEKLA